MCLTCTCTKRQKFMKVKSIIDHSLCQNPFNVVCVENLLHISCSHGSFRQNNYCNSFFENHIKDNEITILIRGQSLSCNKLDRNWEIENFLHCQCHITRDPYHNESKMFLDLKSYSDFLTIIASFILFFSKKSVITKSQVVTIYKIFHKVC